MFIGGFRFCFRLPLAVYQPESGGGGVFDDESSNVLLFRVLPVAPKRCYYFLCAHCSGVSSTTVSSGVLYLLFSQVATQLEEAPVVTVHPEYQARFSSFWSR